MFNSINSEVVLENDPIFDYTCDRKIEFIEKGVCKYSFLNYFNIYLPGLIIYAYKPVNMLNV